MNASHCNKCNVDGIPDPVVPNRWRCPSCKREIIAVDVLTETNLRDSIGAQGQSAETINDLPVREFTRQVSEDGSGSGIDIKREETGVSQVSRTLHPTGPAPRDPQGQRKAEEEQRTIRALLPVFNRLHGTEYESIGPGNDERGDDVIAKSSNEGELDIRFQLTFADTDGTLRASISRGRQFSAVEDEKDLLARAADALRKKSRAPDAGAILVLDGSGIGTPPGTVERFARECRTDLAAARFLEIWWADHGTGGVVRRLWPKG